MNPLPQKHIHTYAHAHAHAHARTCTHTSRKRSQEIHGYPEAKPRWVFFFFLCCCCCCCCCFRAAHVQIMEVSRLGVKSELEQRAYITATAPPDPSHVCNARSLTHWVKPGTEPSFSWILVGFVTNEPQQEFPKPSFKISLLQIEFPNINRAGFFTHLSHLCFPFLSCLLCKSLRNTILELRGRYVILFTCPHCHPPSPKSQIQ